MDTLSQKINSLPQNSAVLFTSLYKDKMKNILHIHKYEIF